MFLYIRNSHLREINIIEKKFNIIELQFENPETTNNTLNNIFKQLNATVHKHEDTSLQKKFLNNI